MTSKISITRALAELKVLQKRIDKLNDTSLFITTVVSGRPFASGIEDAQSNWASLNDLIRRYETLKFAILNSNASTRVKIGHRTYTVTEAIAQKECIKQQQTILENLKRQFNDVQNFITNNDVQTKDKLDRLLEINFKERKTSEDDIRIIREAYLKSNEVKVIDPLDLKTVISSMEISVEEFLKDVDFILSESNAITQIEV